MLVGRIINGFGMGKAPIPPSSYLLMPSLS